MNTSERDSIDLYVLRVSFKVRRTVEAHTGACKPSIGKIPFSCRSLNVPAFRSIGTCPSYSPCGSVNALRSFICSCWMIVHWCYSSRIPTRPRRTLGTNIPRFTRSTAETTVSPVLAEVVLRAECKSKNVSPGSKH